MRSGIRIWQLLVVATTTWAIGGCSFWANDDSCESIEEYQNAQAAQEISVPAGLDKPDPSSKLAVPAEPKPAVPLSTNAACLQRPPDYFDKPLKGSGN